MCVCFFAYTSFTMSNIHTCKDAFQLSVCHIQKSYSFINGQQRDSNHLFIKYKHYELRTLVKKILFYIVNKNILLNTLLLL